MKLTNKNKLKVEVEFTNEVLGTLSGTSEITKEFIASKHPDGVQQDEIEALGVDEEVSKKSTVFPRDKDGNIVIYDYQIKGMIKGACYAMIHSGNFTDAKLKKYRLTNYLYKKTIDTQIFVKPRQIIVQLPEGVDANKLPFCERPLRAETMRGERIALARSETIPAGSKISFEIVTFNQDLMPLIKEWLDSGEYLGFLQWRSSGKGSFIWKELK